jgi:hypothetical protein
MRYYEMSSLAAGEGAAAGGRRGARRAVAACAGRWAWLLRCSAAGPPLGSTACSPAPAPTPTRHRPRPHTPTSPRHRPRHRHRPAGKSIGGKSIDEEELLMALQLAITCTILAAAGAQRARMLSTLYRDERSARLPVFPFLEKVYLERILRRWAGLVFRAVRAVCVCGAGLGAAAGGAAHGLLGVASCAGGCRGLLLPGAPERLAPTPALAASHPRHRTPPAGRRLRRSAAPSSLTSWPRCPTAPPCWTAP